MRITFRDGFKVEIDDKDIEGMSKHQIIMEAMAAKDSVKKQVNDVPFEFGYNTKHANQITKIKNAIDRRTGEVLNPQALKKQIEIINIDLDADLDRHQNWGRTRPIEALEEVINQYEKYAAELKKARDPEFVAKYEEVADKIDLLKHNWGLTAGEEVDEEVRITDTPLGEMSRRVSFRNAPNADFSETNLNTGFERALSKDQYEHKAGIRLIKNEFEDLKTNLEYDIEHAGELVPNVSKEDLRLAMDIYDRYIEAFNFNELQAEYNKLKELYGQLYYNAYHLGVRSPLSGTRESPVRRRRA